MTHLYSFQRERELGDKDIVKEKRNTEISVWTEERHENENYRQSNSQNHKYLCNVCRYDSGEEQFTVDCRLWVHSKELQIGKREQDSKTGFVIYSGKSWGVLNLKLSPWHEMAPETMWMPMVHAPTNCVGQENYFCNSTNDYSLTIEKEGQRRCL